MVHCRSDRFAWRSTWILGRARVTIEASRRIIKAPRQVTTSVITWLARWVVLIMYSNLLHAYTLYIHVFLQKKHYARRRTAWMPGIWPDLIHRLCQPESALHQPRRVTPV